MKMYLEKEFSFEAAHALQNYQGDCANLHGHSYKVRVCVSRDVALHKGVDPNNAMVVDFKKLKTYVKEVLDMFDHTYLNTSLIMTYTTAESIAYRLFSLLELKLNPTGVRLESISIMETEGSWVKLKGEDFYECKP